MTEAIRIKERPKPYTPDWVEAHRYFDLALCNWLLNSEHDEESLARGVHHQKKDLERKRNKEFPYLEFLDAEAYQDIMAWPGDRPPKDGEDYPMSFHNFLDEGVSSKCRR